MTWVKAEYRSLDGTNCSNVYINLEHVSAVVLEPGGNEVRLKCAGNGSGAFALAKDVLAIILPLGEPTPAALDGEQPPSGSRLSANPRRATFAAAVAHRRATRPDPAGGPRQLALVNSAA